MAIDLSGLEAIVISHGHADHTLGLPRLLDRLASRRLRVVAHPDAFLERRVASPAVTVIMPRLDREGVRRRANVKLVETRDPTLLLDGTLLVSGEIARTTSFEVGFRPTRRGETASGSPIRWCSTTSRWPSTCAAGAS
jgi:7,8-dihydropterin-6-yl-methyl-4-(beta-D-ribofuranosyl)aminobenzene 5'-phosphate synthase